MRAQDARKQRKSRVVGGEWGKIVERVVWLQTCFGSFGRSAATAVATAAPGGATV